MNERHRIDLPRIVLVGRGVLESLGEVFLELGLRRPLIVTGRVTYNIAGAKAEEILTEVGLSPRVVFCEVADLETVERVSDEAGSIEADAVVGVGGGRTIDVAKLGAFNNQASFISVPTIAAHDGIASSLASVKGFGRPYSMKANPPIAVLADSGIISESPYRFTASGCGDVISKVVSVRDWKLAHVENGDYYGEYAGSLALMGSRLIRRSSNLIKARTEEGIRTLLEALVSCGVSMSIAGSSRPCSGSEHLFSHTLDMLAPGTALHGEQCGVGTIMMAKLHGLDWEDIRENLRLIGAPTTAEDLGVSEEVLVEALVKARTIRPERYTILDKVVLTRESAGDLARFCGVL
ncbi:MAG: NAD(P)-dependent glycerol-1-phosphate dehydrogenase [Candidatus Bathyarchaeota archaeon]